ncbi:hypothetical protein B0I35DRAFT_422831 [Stachybotrys elegans]|uniref:Uncharacterized protein n=1 Tax=Stachybotrys elegans TaxID=80388 RepID=A0A8K0WWG3_9HYPO|nr:hypothetical protein B0I35DRAFT_422831 [Stachybotrys elegans]
MIRHIFIHQTMPCGFKSTLPLHCPWLSIIGRPPIHAALSIDTLPLSIDSASGETARALLPLPIFGSVTKTTPAFVIVIPLARPCRHAQCANRWTRPGIVFNHTLRCDTIVRFDCCVATLSLAPPEIICGNALRARTHTAVANRQRLRVEGAARSVEQGNPREEQDSTAVTACNVSAGSLWLPGFVWAGRGGRRRTSDVEDRRVMTRFDAN